MAQDMTRAQATAWVHQEAAKHRTNDQRRERIAGERRAIQEFEAIGLDETLPMSFSAHEHLIEFLEEEIEADEERRRRRPQMPDGEHDQLDDPWNEPGAPFRSGDY